MTNIDYNTLIAEGIQAMRKERNELRIKWIENRDWDIDPQLQEAYAAKEWHFDLQRRFKLHPVVVHMLTRHEPADWKRLLQEWPHISESDPNRLAYTRDEAAGKRDLQTVTSVGKYIKRHWPNVPDHKLRDAQAVYHPDTLEIVEGIEQLIVGIELGPRSCMQSGYGSIPFNEQDHRQMKRWLNDKTEEVPDWYSHPYAVYAPEYGWKMVIRKNCEGQILGRCLINENGKVYVRSYKRGKVDSDSSETDHIIEAWLNERGWTKIDAWPEGTKFSSIEHPSDDDLWLLPYIDGNGEDCRKLTLCSGWFERSDEGEYNCCNTNGEADYDPPPRMVECDHCHTEVPEASLISTDEDSRVCSSCFHHYYTYAYRAGPRGQARTVVVAQENTSPVYRSYLAYERGEHSTPVVTESIPSHYVYLPGCKCYADIDYTVMATNGYRFFADDPSLVRLYEDCPVAHSRYAHKDDAWQDGYGNWHSNELDAVIVNGKEYVEKDCIQCELTGQWYLCGSDFFMSSDGQYIAKEALERVSSDAEWGDELLAEFHQDEINAATIKENLRYLREKSQAAIYMANHYINYYAAV